MFACLSLPAAVAESPAVEPDVLEVVARAFSPRVEVHAPHLVTLDIAGLGRLLGTPAEIGRELVRDAGERGCAADIAIAGGRTAAMLLALACDGLTVVPPGHEARTLANLPLGVLQRLATIADGGAPTANGQRKTQHTALPGTAPSSNRRTVESPKREIAKPTDDLPVLALFRRWGLRTLGDLAALPAAALSERIGQDGLRWQRVARGEDLQPLVAMPPEAPIEEVLDLDWPVEGFEPLSFLLPRLLEPICERLERLDQAAVGLELSFRLATRELELRRIQLPAPMRDAKVLRTLVLLHLESHPLGAGVDRLMIRVETAPARIVQFSLLSRALPFPEQVATLTARLGALMGERRVGAPAIVDSYRPGVFAMQAFSVSEKADGGKRKAEIFAESRSSGLASASLVLRRFRLPVAARVIDEGGRPVRVTTERRGLEGGHVESSAGPWRTSGEWWRVEQPATDSGHLAADTGSLVEHASRLSVGGGQWTVDREGGNVPAENGKRTTDYGAGPCPRRGRGAAGSKGWNRDEWDVALSDGAVYRIHRDRTTERWFIDGIFD